MLWTLSEDEEDEEDEEGEDDEEDEENEEDEEDKEDEDEEDKDSLYSYLAETHLYLRGSYEFRWRYPLTGD